MEEELVEVKVSPHQFSVNLTEHEYGRFMDAAYYLGRCIASASKHNSESDHGYLIINGSTIFDGIEQRIADGLIPEVYFGYVPDTSNTPNKLTQKYMDFFLSEILTPTDGTAYAVDAVVYDPHATTE